MIKSANFNSYYLKQNFFFQDIDGEYQVELTFTMVPELAGKPFSLEIENELGKTTYEFDLALDDQPPSGK